MHPNKCYAIYKISTIQQIRLKLMRPKIVAPVNNERGMTRGGGRENYHKTKKNTVKHLKPLDLMD